MKNTPAIARLGELDAAHFRDLLARVCAPDSSAWTELLQHARPRLEHLARNMLRHFPALQRQTEVDDLVQACLLRLLRALQQLKLDSVEDFFGLAAEEVRRELLDLARKAKRSLAQHCPPTRRNPFATAQPDIADDAADPESPGQRHGYL